MLLARPAVNGGALVADDRGIAAEANFVSATPTFNSGAAQCVRFTGATARVQDAACETTLSPAFSSSSVVASSNTYSFTVGVSGLSPNYPWEFYI